MKNLKNLKLTGNKKKKKIVELKKDLASLKEKFMKFDKTLDRQEQHSRRNCLLMHGVDGKNDEYTNQAIINIIKNYMGEEITIYDIHKTHLLGK